MIFVGVDAGGSKCRCRIQNPQRQTLGEGVAGPANLRLGREYVLEAVRLACARALQAAGLTEQALKEAVVCIGMAGIERTDNNAPFDASELGCAALRFETDAVIANVGSHQGADGGTVIIGTGSIGILQLGDKTSRIGGHGFPVSDEGSGAHIGFLGVRATLNAFDGLVPKTEFIEEIDSHFGGDRAAMLTWLDKATPTDFGTLAPIVVEYANAGDENAVAILKEAAAHVAQMLESLVNAGAPRLSLQGGLAAIVRKWLPVELLERVSDPLGDPLSGALLLAHQMAVSVE